MNASASMSVDPLSMKSVLDRVEMLEKSYQEERLAVSFPTLRRCRPGALRSPASPPAPACVRACVQRMMIEGEITKERSEVRRRALPLPRPAAQCVRPLAQQACCVRLTQRSPFNV
jgi:Fe-S-cluster-containing dehydrogenase component